MKKTFLAVLACLVVSPVLAASDAEELGRCIYNNTSTADRDTLVQFMYVSLGSTNAARKVQSIPQTKIRVNNIGATVRSKAFRLTRDGFTFLVMGYTGEKAAKFKWAYIDEFNKQQALLESQALPQTQFERTKFASDSLAENVLRGLSGQIDAENVGDKLVTIGTVLQVVGAIQKVPASGPQLQAALNAFQQVLEKSCDADELERQRRRSLKARNAARARWDRIRQGGAE